MTTEPDRLAAAFSQARPRLVRVAYAIIGSHSEAEDVVADCWFRLVAAVSCDSQANSGAGGRRSQRNP